MNLQYIVVLCVVVLLGVGGWFLLQTNEEAPAENSITTDEENTNTKEQESVPKENNDSLSGAGSFASLMGLGRNLTCDFTDVSEETNGAVAGTVYIAGEKLRGDFEMEQAGVVYESHMIHDDSTIYTWTESDQGMVAMKFSKPEDETTIGSDSSESAGESFSMDESVDYDCRPWSVDQSVFVPPSNIEFTDFDVFMQNAMQGLDVGSLDFQLPTP